jgi:hypothetical protein
VQLARHQMIFLIFCSVLWEPHSVRAWGDEGHAVVALIAEHYLQPQVRERVRALLDADRSGLVTDTSMASEAAWADRFRDSDRDGTRVRYDATKKWHYVDLELDSPDLTRACGARGSLPAGTPASQGPASDCVVDKINQFERELRDPQTTEDERRVALQFLLHFVGDVHQPLHASDDGDEGGNRKQVETRGWPAASLHHYWDVEFVSSLGAEPRVVAERLLRHISARDVQSWQQGNADEWALESYALAKRVAYGMLSPPTGHHRYRLSAGYVQTAIETVQSQLMRAGVRLAALLNRVLADAPLRNPR